MIIDIQASGFPLTECLREHTRKRLQFVLGWAGNEARQISVALSDDKAAPDGKDKRCRIHVPIVGARDILIEDVQEDLYLAISRAAERIERLMTRRLAHRRERIAALKAKV